MAEPRITIIDEGTGTVTVRQGDREDRYPMATAEGFDAASAAWLRVGWDAKHVYSFTWMGRPIIQLPEDMIRLQEVIYALKPDVIVETGVAHGGSLVFYAGLMSAMGKGRVIGVDIEIRPHNRAAIESHEMASRIQLIEGSSTDEATLAQVRALIGPEDRVLVLLDSNHSKEHVLAELRSYASLVPVGSWIVACDGIMAAVAGGPRTAPDWSWNNPISAVEAFLAERDDFVPGFPPFAFNEGMVSAPVTYWPEGWLRRARARDE